MVTLKYAVVALAAVIGSGCSPESPVEPKTPRIVPVAEARLETVERSSSQVGEVRPHHDTAMSFRAGGLVSMRVSVGSTVRKGDLLAALDRKPASNQVRTARTETALANAELALASLTVERQRTLFEKNATPRAILEEAEAKLATSRARVDAAEALLDRAEDALSYTELRAPHDGTVSAVQADKDEVVAAGQVILELISTQQRDAVFDVPEVLYRTAPENASIALRLVTDPTIVATGTVSEVAPSADRSTRSYRIEVAMDPNGALMPYGAPVVGTIVLSRNSLIKLPASALTNSADGASVFVADEATGLISRRAVTLESFDERFLFVASGLREGELVATSGVSKLRDGEQVGLKREAK